MGEDKPGWYYVGTGKLRYNDGDGWTDQYKPIEGPRTETTPMVDEWSDARLKKSPDKTNPHRRTSPVVIALCVGLLALGVGGGLLKAGPLSAWATEQAGQISALISPPAPTAQAIAAKPKAKAKAKAPLKAAAPKAAAPKAAAPKAAAPKAAAPEPNSPAPLEPAPLAPRKPSPAPAPVSRPEARPTPTTHVRTADDCNGDLVASSRILVSGSTATLLGTMTNETGFDVYYSGMPPYVITFDTDGSRPILRGDFSTPPREYPYSGDWVMHPGASVAYRSLPVRLQTPDRRWTGDWDRWTSGQFTTLDVMTFCSQREVPTIQIIS